MIGQSLFQVYILNTFTTYMRAAKPLLLTSLFFILFYAGFAQSDSSSSRALFTIGIGNYEYLHIGLDKNFQRTARYVEVGAGINPIRFSTDHYVMTYLNVGSYIFTKLKNNKLQWGVHINNILWHLSNPYNLFNVYGVGMALKCKWPLASNIELHTQVGWLYNTVVTYQRKTFEEVGWPKQWQPSFSLQCKFRLK